MTVAIHPFLEQLTPLDTCHHGGLMAVRLGPERPGLAGAPVAPPVLLIAPLAAALASGTAQLAEVGSGRVDTLLVTNRGSVPLFGMVGELLAGGRQDRVLNTDVLIAPGRQVEVRVSCVEARRWSDAGSGSTFQGTSASATPTVRSTVHHTVVQSVRRTGRHDTDQRAVWRGVDESLRRTGVHHIVATGTLVGGLRRHAKTLTGYATACGRPLEGRQLGVALFTPGAPQAALFGFSSLDGFGSPGLLGHYLDRLVRGAAAEAVAEPGEAPVPIRPPDVVTADLLRCLADLRPVVTRPAAGGTPEAQERHYVFDGLVASLLTWQGHAIHLSVTAGPVDDAAGPLPGTGSGPRSAHGSAPGLAHGSAPGLAHGSAPGLAHGSAPGLAHGSAPRPAHGSAPGLAHGSAPACARPEAVTMPMASAPVVLLRIAGSGHGERSQALGLGRYTVGRSRQCDLQLEDEDVSRIHAVLEITPQGVSIRDRKSTNGLLVNGEPVLYAALQPGDKVCVGAFATLTLLP